MDRPVKYWPMVLVLLLILVVNTYEQGQKISESVGAGRRVEAIADSLLVAANETRAVNRSVAQGVGIIVKENRRTAAVNRASFRAIGRQLSRQVRQVRTAVDSVQSVLPKKRKH